MPLFFDLSLEEGRKVMLLSCDNSTLLRKYTYPKTQLRGGWPLLAISPMTNEGKKL